MTRFLPTCKPSTWILILGLFVGLSVLLWPEFAHATEDTSMVAGFLYKVVLSLTGWMLFVGGMLLDYGINTFVINFGTVFNSGGVGEAVNQLWAMVRDLFNILFIFGLVYIGFKMILNSDDSQTKKTLISLIIAALLMNFSLFITKFVVDFSNILASEVALAGFENTNALGDDISSISVGNTFFDLMGVARFLETNPSLTDAEPWSFIFGMGIINIIGAFAFGVGGIMLVIRFIALSVYMVLSPFMFLGWIFPGFQSMSSKYWSGFFKQAFYAPVYIVMVFFSATILRNFFGSGGAAQRGGLDENLQQGANTFGTVTGDVTAVADNFAGGLGPFILSAGFLIAAVQVAGKLSADGSGVMAKVGGFVNSRVRRTVGRGVAGVPAYGLRNTVGAGANAYANSEGGKRRAANSILGKIAFNAAKGTADRSFDARRVAGVGKAIGAGEGQKGGFAKTLKDRGKKEDDFAKSIAGDFDEKAPESQPLINKKIEEVRSKKKEELDAIRASIIDEKAIVIEKIEGLESEIATAGTTTAEQKIKLTALNKELEQTDEVTNIKIDNLTTLLDGKSKNEAKLRTVAIGQLKFKNELAYVEQLQSSEKFFKSIYTKIGATVGAGGAAIGIGAAPIGGIAAAAAMAAMFGNAQSAKAGHKAITKRIGVDGSKAIKSAGADKILKELTDKMKEGDEPKEEAKDETA
jgi:hypothetical protein